MNAIVKTTPANGRFLADELYIKGYVDDARKIRSLADQVEALTKERDALVADAVRYRFITAHIVDEGDMDVLERAVESLGESDTCTQAESDTCIDVAIVKEQRQVGVQ